ncbi:MAG: aminoacyl-tRNA hydrolase [Acidimicrobiia bacterium]|nr:aminoacyl-tRNA hydrolase [Acidimicrobiia bacterium]
MRNPGERYRLTRHNLGADVVATVAQRHRATFKRAKRTIRAEVAETQLAGSRAVLALPTTFMNESGQAVAPLLRYFRAEPSQLLIVHDDIDLPFAKMRLQYDRGSGGNNGAGSVIRALGSQEFWRLKCGVGRPPGRMDPADFVLKRFTRKEQPEIDLMVQWAADVVERFVAEGGEAAQQLTGGAGANG